MKKHLKAFFTNIYIITFIYLAIIAQFAFVLLDIVLSCCVQQKISMYVSLVIGTFFVLFFGFFIGKKLNIKNSFFSFFPSFLVLILLTSVWIVIFYFAKTDDSFIFYKISAVLSLNFIVFVVYSSINLKFLFFSVVSTYIAFDIGLYLAIKKQTFPNSHKKAMLIIVAIISVFIVLCLYYLYKNYSVFKHLNFY